MRNTQVQTQKYTNTKTPIQIEDSPAFPHRGVMLDTARNFIPIENIKKVLPQKISQLFEQDQEASALSR